MLVGAKRKKSSPPEPVPGPLQDGPLSPVTTSPAVGAAALSESASSTLSQASSSEPFLFTAGSLPAEADELEEASQRLVEACRAGDAAALSARLTAALVNRPARQGAVNGFSAPPLWWCAARGARRRAA
jgi:hypothetical protein